jgi:hypothetical protein
MAERASAAPPVPRASTSTASLDVYLRRNLDGQNQQGAAIDAVHVVVLPSSRLGQGALVCCNDLYVFEAVQRHCVAEPGTEAADGALSAGTRERRRSSGSSRSARTQSWRSGWRLSVRPRWSGVGGRASLVVAVADHWFDCAAVARWAHCFWAACDGKVYTVRGDGDGRRWNAPVQ